MRSPVLLVALALGGMLVAAPPAHAFFRITTVACDTVGTNPLQVRTTFNVDLVGPGGYCWFSIFPQPVGPGPDDATVFYSAVAPAGWSVAPNVYGDGARGYLFNPYPRCFGTGDHFEGFQVVANRAGPCALFIFDNPVMEGDVGTGCLVLDGPVPAGSASWGRVKAIYRQ